MIVVLSGVMAFGAPAGFKVTKTTESCTIYSGPAVPTGAVPMLAECRWPNLTLAKVDAVFSPWKDHDLFFSAIAASDVERTVGDTAYVRQVHQARGISDRECVLAMRKSTVDGGLRFEWTLDPTPITIAEGRVAVAHDDGHWLFTPHPDGGVSVSYYLEYDPGGSVPGFLVRSFQSSGFEAAVTELRAYIEGH